MQACDRDEHATRDEALECVRHRCAERAANRSANWQAQFDRLLTLYADPPDDIDPPPPEPLSREWQERFVATLADAPDFRAAVAAWTGGEA